jgi:hypothetical protein
MNSSLLEDTKCDEKHQSASSASNNVTSGLGEKFRKENGDLNFFIKIYTLITHNIFYFKDKFHV